MTRYRLFFPLAAIVFIASLFYPITERITAFARAAASAWGVDPRAAFIAHQEGWGGNTLLKRTPAYARTASFRGRLLERETSRRHGAPMNFGIASATV